MRWDKHGEQTAASAAIKLDSTNIRTRWYMIFLVLHNGRFAACTVKAHIVRISEALAKFLDQDFDCNCSPDVRVTLAVKAVAGVCCCSHANLRAVVLDLQDEDGMPDTPKMVQEMARVPGCF